MKMTIAQMKARIAVLEKAATQGWLALIFQGACEELKDAYWDGQVKHLKGILDASNKNRIKHAELVALVAEAEVLAVKAVEMAYPLLNGNFHMIPVEDLVEAEQRFYSEVYGFIDEHADRIASEIAGVEFCERVEVAKIAAEMQAQGITLDMEKVDRLTLSEMEEIKQGLEDIARELDQLDKDVEAAQASISNIQTMMAPKPRKTKDVGLMTTADIPQYIKEILFTKVQAIPRPWGFTLRGTPGMRTTTADSAGAALFKLTQWAERLGAEVNILHNGFTDARYYAKGSLAANTRISVEITDPVARLIEAYLEEIHGKYWKISKPKDSQDWKWAEEKRKHREAAFV